MLYLVIQASYGWCQHTFYTLLNCFCSWVIWDNLKHAIKLHIASCCRISISSLINPQLRTVNDLMLSLMLISLFQLVLFTYHRVRFGFVCFPEICDLKVESLSITLLSWSYHSLVNFRLKADRNF